MRLIEKKCPNCGAELTFGFEDKETKCEYCGKSFEIERTTEEKNDLYNADNYQIFEEASRTISKGFGAFFLIPVIFIFVVGIMIIASLRIFSARPNHENKIEERKIMDKEDIEEMNKREEEYQKTVEEKMKEAGFVLSFNDLSKQHLSDIRDNSVSILKKEIERYDAFLYPYGKWSYVGMYLVTNEKGNNLYDVYKINFKVNGKQYPFYAGVRYLSAKVVDGKLVMDMNGYVVGSANMRSGGYKDTFGFESTKDFYNKNIRGLLGSNKVQSSGDVYSE